MKQNQEEIVDIVSRIVENMSQFRNAEKQLAQAITSDVMFAAGASISELAVKADVSEATVTRFAKSVGCQHFRELKMFLAQSASVGARFFKESDSEPSSINGVYESILRSLKRNEGHITPDALQDAAEYIHHARQVIILGVGGSSTMLAQECQYRLFRLGVNAVAYSDPMLMRMATSATEKDDVVFCLSLGGVSPDVAEAANIAKNYGATVLSITPAKTPLAKIVDVNLPIVIRENDFIFKPTSSRYVMLAAIDMLMTEVATRNKRKSRDKLRRMKQQLDAHRKGGNRLPLGD